MSQPLFRHPCRYPRVCDTVFHPNLAFRQRHLCPQLPRALATMVQWPQGLTGHLRQLKAEALSKPTPLLGVAGGGVGRKASLLASVCGNSAGPPSSELLVGLAEDSIAIASPFNFASFPVLLSSFPYKLQSPTCKPNLRRTPSAFPPCLFPPIKRGHWKRVGCTCAPHQRLQHLAQNTTVYQV